MHKLSQENDKDTLEKLRGIAPHSIFMEEKSLDVITSKLDAVTSKLPNPGCMMSDVWPWPCIGCAQRSDPKIKSQISCDLGATNKL